MLSKHEWKEWTWFFWLGWQHFPFYRGCFPWGSVSQGMFCGMPESFVVHDLKSTLQHSPTTSGCEAWNLKHLMWFWTWRQVQKSFFDLFVWRGSLEGRKWAASNCHAFNVFAVQFLYRVWFFAAPWTAVSQAPLSLEFSRQEYWGRLPFPSPGGLPYPGIKSGSPALKVDSLSSESPQGLFSKCLMCSLFWEGGWVVTFLNKHFLGFNLILFGQPSIA